MTSGSATIEAAGTTPAALATESAGSGPAFLWGHSLLGSMAQDRDGGVLDWHELTDSLQVIRYDARGHGASGSEGQPEDFRWDRLAVNMWQVADHYTSEPLVLGGASMGCGTALHAACQRPGQLRGLVLVVPPTAWEWREPRRAGYRVTANLVKYSFAAPLRLLSLLPATPVEGDFGRNMLAAMCRHLPNVEPKGVIGAMRGAALADFPSREQLAAMDIPTLILAWPGDKTHPLAVAEALRDILPRAELVVSDRQAGPYEWPRRVGEFIAGLD